MSTPDEVLRAVNDPKHDVAAMLRLCLQLPAGTTSAEFQAWVHKELDGYDGADKLPRYRMADLESRGAANNGGWSYSDVPVSGILPDDSKVKPWADAPFRIQDGVAAIAELIEHSRSSDGSLGAEWPMDIVQVLNMEISQGVLPVHHSYRFERVWTALPRGRLVEVLDRIRTRVAEEIGPLATGVATGGAPTAVSVTGSHNQITVQSPGSTQWQLQLQAGDVDGLMTALRQEGVNDSDLITLRTIVDDTTMTEERRLHRALEWVKTLALSTPAEVGSAVIAGMILRHFNLG